MLALCRPLASMPCTFVLAAAMAAALPVHAAGADPLLTVYAIRGFAGIIFSRGMNTLCEQLARIPEVSCRVDDFYNASEIETKAAADMAAGQQVVFVGHSMGAHAALRIAAAMKGPVPLIVTIDPNWFPPPPVVPENAVLVVNYYQNFDVLGRAMLSPSAGFHGQLYQYRRSEAHVVMDGSSDIRASMISHLSVILSGLQAPLRSALHR